MGKRLITEENYMNIKECLKYAVKELKNNNIETPELEAGVLLCYILKCNRSYLYSHDDRILDEKETLDLNDILNKRINNMPLQYIIGKTEFMGLPFYVSPAVLIPRQDTEIIVEECLKIIDSISRQNIIENRTTQYRYDENEADKNEINEYQNIIKVLDMCTGSGCIAISIAHYSPTSIVTACDISQDALCIAKENCKLNKIEKRVNLRCGNLFDALDGQQKFNMIVSNPPYIETKDIVELQKEVKDYEPSLALDGGHDGLNFYRKIIANAPKYLTNCGYLVFEIGYNQGKSVKNLMNKYFCDVNVYKDLSGNDRVIVGRYCR